MCSGQYWFVEEQKTKQNKKDLGVVDDNYSQTLYKDRKVDGREVRKVLWVFRP